MDWLDSPLGSQHSWHEWALYSSVVGSLVFVGSFAVGWPAAAAAVGFVGSFGELPSLRVSQPVEGTQRPVVMRLFLGFVVAVAAVVVVAAVIAVAVVVAAVMAVVAGVAAVAATVVAAVDATVVAEAAVAAGSCKDSSLPSILEDPLMLVA